MNTTKFIYVAAAFLFSVAGVSADTYYSICRGLRLDTRLVKTVSDSLRIDYSPVDAEFATVLVNRVALLSSAEAGCFMWQPQSCGNYTLTHVAGTNEWTREVSVTSVLSPVAVEPDPPMALNSNIEIASAGRTFANTGGSFMFRTAGSGDWTAATSANWIVLQTGSESGTAGGRVAYTVSANTGAETRIGYVYVAGRVHTVTQTGVAVSLSAAQTNIGSTGGEASFDVAADDGISWTAYSESEWITIESGSGNGNGSVRFCVAPWHEASVRTGKIVVGASEHTVVQTGIPIKVVPARFVVGYGAESVVADVSALAGVAWNASASGVSSWVSVTKNGNRLTLQIAENPSFRARSGVVSVGTEQIRIEQAGRSGEGLAFALASASASIGEAGGEVTCRVTATPDMPWQVVSDADWIRCAADGTFGGTANTRLTVDGNDGMSERRGHVRLIPATGTGLATLEFEVVQAASTASTDLASYDFSPAGESASVQVTVRNGVNWTIVNPVDWVQIDGSLSRTGGGAVRITVGANPGVTKREGVLTIAGHEFKVSQSGRGVSFGAESIVLNSGEFTVGEVAVTVEGGAASWSAVAYPENGWIYITGKTNCEETGDGSVAGNGNGVLEYWLEDAFASDMPRTGWVEIAGKRVYITQRAGAVALGANGKDVSCAAGSGTISVTAASGVKWNVISLSDWITAGTASGTGNGAVSIGWTANSGSSARTGKVLVAGEVYEVRQSEYKEEPEDPIVTPGGGDGEGGGSGEGSGTGTGEGSGTGAGEGSGSGEEGGSGAGTGGDAVTIVEWTLVQEQGQTYAVSADGRWKLGSYSLDSRYYGQTDLPDGTTGVMGLCWDGYSSCSGSGQLEFPNRLKDAQGKTYGVWIGNPDESGFEGCEGVTRVVVPRGVVGGASYAFGEQRELYSASIGMKTIPEWFLGDCPVLRTVVLEEGVENIDDEAFASDDIAMDTIWLPSTLKTMGDNVFGWENVGDVVLAEGNSAFEIADGALYAKSPRRLIVCPRNWKAREITVLPGTVSIGSFAFAKSAVEKVNLTASLADVGMGAFSFSALKTISLEANANLKLEDGVLYSGDGKRLLVYPVGSARNRFAVPEGVTEIADASMVGSKSLKTIVMPGSLERIGSGVFLDCTALTRVYFMGGSDKELHVGDFTFENCPFTELDLRYRKAVTLGEECIWGAGLTKLYLPEDTKFAGGFVFGGSKLTDVYWWTTKSKAEQYRITSGDGGLIFGKSVNLHVMSGNTQWSTFSEWSGIDITVTKDLQNKLTEQLGYLPFASVDANGGTAGAASVALKRAETGAVVFAAALPSASRSGYTFAGWHTLPYGGTEVTAADATAVFMASAGVPKLYAQWKNSMGAVALPSGHAAVAGDAAATWSVSGLYHTVRPGAGRSEAEVILPAGINPAYVRLQVDPSVERVKLNGATLKVVRGTTEITQHLDVPPAGADGWVDLAKAVVKQEVADEALDPAKGAQIELGAEATRLKTSATKAGLTYQLYEGETLDAMRPGDVVVGDGNAWEPAVTVKGGESGFYTIRVGK